MDSERVTQMRKDVADFGVKVAMKDKNKFLEMNAKFEKVIEAYDERGRKMNEMEKIISNLQKQQGKRKVGEEPS